MLSSTGLKSSKLLIKCMKRPRNSPLSLNRYRKTKTPHRRSWDLLFVAINLARKSGVDPETALIGCNKKLKRFNYIEQKINSSNKSFSDTTLDEMEKLWQESKSIKR